MELFRVEPPPEYNVLEDDLLAANGHLDLFRRAFAGETVHVPTFWYDPRELKVVHVTEGRRVAVSATIFPLFKAGGEIEYVAATFKDETEVVLAQERLPGGERQPGAHRAGAHRPASERQSRARGLQLLGGARPPRAAARDRTASARCCSRTRRRQLEPRRISLERIGGARQMGSSSRRCWRCAGLGRRLWPQARGPRRGSRARRRSSSAPGNLIAPSRSSIAGRHGRATRSARWRARCRQPARQRLEVHRQTRTARDRGRRPRRSTARPRSSSATTAPASTWRTPASCSRRSSACTGQDEFARHRHRPRHLQRIVHGTAAASGRRVGWARARPFFFTVPASR